MKTTVLQSAILCACLCAGVQAKEITLTVNSGEGRGPVKLTDEVVINANETAQVTSSYGGINTTLSVIKNGITNGILASEFFQGGNHGQGIPVAVTGPATMRLWVLAQYNESCFCTVKIEPESFPPGQTLVLPAGTVGIVHVQSSTNLIEWQDEWTHTFSNTNQNRFFRLSAERSLP